MSVKLQSPRMGETGNHTGDVRGVWRPQTLAEDKRNRESQMSVGSQFGALLMLPFQLPIYLWTLCRPQLIDGSTSTSFSTDRQQSGSLFASVLGALLGAVLAFLIVVPLTIYFDWKHAYSETMRANEIHQVSAATVVQTDVGPRSH